MVTLVPPDHAGAAAPAPKIDAIAMTRNNLPIVISLSSSRVAAGESTIRLRNFVHPTDCESVIRSQKVVRPLLVARFERAPENTFCARGIRCAVGPTPRHRRRFPIFADYKRCTTTAGSAW